MDITDTVADAIFDAALAQIHKDAAEELTAAGYLVIPPERAAAEKEKAVAEKQDAVEAAGSDDALAVRAAAARELLAKLGLKTPALWEMRAVVAALATSERRGAASEGEAYAKTCEDLWRNAPNVRPDYTQNAISHGCIASAKAIRARSAALRGALKEAE